MKEPAGMVRLVPVRVPAGGPKGPRRLVPVPVPAGGRKTFSPVPRGAGAGRGPEDF